MQQLTDHPDRYRLANELHARPFPVLAAPSRAVFLALMPAAGGADRDRDRDRAHLVALLDRFGATHPQPGATHYFADLGPFRLKWESHTEIVTYTAFLDGLGARAFDPADAGVFPADWLAAAPGARLTSALIRVEPQAEPDETAARLGEWFVPESVAASEILDGAAVVAGDFRIDTAGHVRLAAFIRPGTGQTRIGRVVQRLCEIETYKTLSMLGFGLAQGLSGPLGAAEARLTALVGAMAAETGEAVDAEALSRLLAVSAELERLAAGSQFRFAATAAYAALVEQRIAILREARYGARQTLAEFMTRRFDPAMRTVRATETRLGRLVERAARAGELLRTRVDVERSAQNQRLMVSMDARAALQLRLQKTVEGLSVVAISYYAVNLAAYLVYPVTEGLGWSKGPVMAGLTPAVVAAVWLVVRRIRRGLH